jgi:hypothetical protein
MAAVGTIGEQPLRRIVVESLEKELCSRRDRMPHAQLGVAVEAGPAAIHKAFSRLHREFDPDSYTTHGTEAMTLAREITALLEAAWLHLGSPSTDDERYMEPRRDETLRALETLRAGIARRKAEALRLKAAGRVVEARRMFEAVRTLDPHDETARKQLRLLRKRPWWLGAIHWLWARIRRQ